MFGSSYVGATQMLAAMAAPPHLKAIFPYVTASEYYDGWTYQNGALMQWVRELLDIRASSGYAQAQGEPAGEVHRVGPGSCR